MARSTERVQRYRQRLREAGRMRLTVLLDAPTQRQLAELAADLSPAAFAATLLTAAIEREVRARTELQRQQAAPPAPSALASAVNVMPVDPHQFPGRRRSLAASQDLPQWAIKR